MLESKRPMHDTNDPLIEFRSVEFSIGGNDIIRKLDLFVERGEVLILLGSSGCGKTTTLKLINRLIEPTAGAVYIAGADSRSMDAVKLRRSIGYVLQEGGLFPHMTVAENIALPVRLEGHATNTDERVRELLTLVGLTDGSYGTRLPHELSGGQHQRVGVARALFNDPDLMLLDEPFGALDAITRNSLQKEFARVVRTMGKTAVFVTHDVAEAMLLGDRIALMDVGQIVFLGTPAEFRASGVPLVGAYLDTLAIERN